jgi:hypothetical protein
VTDPVLAPLLPNRVARRGNREQNHVLGMFNPVRALWFSGGADDVDFSGNLLAEEIEWEVVHVGAKGVLDFASNQHDPENDVRSKDGTWDGNPAENFV